MRTFLIYFLIFGVGCGGLLWLAWDYVTHLRRQMALMRERIAELEERNAELVLALEDRRDVARIDEAIRRGRLPRPEDGRADVRSS